MRFLILLLFGISIISCQNSETPAEAMDRSLIEGYWELIEAARNGKATETLSGAYFHFSSDSIMQTNLLGEKSDQVYHWKDSILVVEGAMPYKVQLLAQDSLKLSFELENFEFDLFLQRSLANE